VKIEIKGIIQKNQTVYILIIKHFSWYFEMDWNGWI